MRSLKPRMQSYTCASMPDWPGCSSCSWLGGHPMTHTKAPEKQRRMYSPEKLEFAGNVPEAM